MSKYEVFRIDDIVRDELTLAYQMNIEYDRDEGGIYLERDEDLLDALEKVIEYYSSEKEYSFFLESVKPMRKINEQAIS